MKSLHLLAITTAFVIGCAAAALAQSPSSAQSAAGANNAPAQSRCVDVNGQVQAKGETTGVQTMSGGPSTDKPNAASTTSSSANAQVKPGPLPGSTTGAQQKQASNGPPC